MLKTIIHLVTFLLWKFQKGLSLDHHLNRVQPPNSPQFGPVSKCTWFSRRSPGSWRTNFEISPMEHPRRIVVTSAVLIHTTVFFFLPHKLDGTKRNFVSPLQQDKLLASRRNVGWPRPLFCGANLCDWEALPTGMNESGNKRRSGGGSGGQGIAGEVGALEGASFHATSFPSRCLPVPVCSRQSGHTRAAVNHHPHFTKSHLLTTLPLPWLHPERESALIALVFCGSEKNQPAQGWAYPGLLYPSAQPINQ